MEPEPHLQTVLFAKVTLALMLGKSAAAYLDKQRAAHIRRMQQFSELNQSGPLIDVLLADHPLSPGLGPPVDRPHGSSTAEGTSRVDIGPMNTL